MAIRSRAEAARSASVSGEGTAIKQGAPASSISVDVFFSAWSWWHRHQNLLWALLVRERVGRFTHRLIRAEDRPRAVVEVLELTRAECPAHRQHGCAAKRDDRADDGAEHGEVGAGHGFFSGGGVFGSTGNGNRP